MYKLISSAKLSFILLLFGFFIFQSCASTKTEKNAITIELSSEGPYFAGPNSFMHEYSVDLSSFISEKTLKASDIKSINLISASLPFEKNSGIDFDMYNNATLQAVSANAPMISLAIINPIASNSGDRINLNVSQEADLASFFRESSFTYLLDLDFKEDDYSDAMSIFLDLELNIEYK